MRGRIRTVKPELFSDEALWDLERETGLPLLRVFIGLWCYCDREGRFVWSPRALRGAIAPCWDGDMSAALEALASKLYIVRYTVNGKDYGYVRTFREHQAINKKEPPSILPAPSEHAVTDFHVPGTGSHVPGTDFHVGKGREGNGYGKGREREERAHAEPDATAFHRERTDPPSHSRPARTFTMPTEEPTQEYLDYAVIAGVSPEQARSTWSHYVGAGLPERGIERLHWWLTQRAKERANSTARALAGPRQRAGPDDALTRQAERVRMLREQEAADDRRGAAGGGA